MKDLNGIAQLKEKLKIEKDAKKTIELQLALAEKMLFVDLEEVLKIADLTKTNADKLGEEVLSFKASLLTLRVLRSLNRPEEVLRLALQLKAAINKNINPNDQFIVHNSLINVYVEKLEFEKAKEICLYIATDLYYKTSTRYQAHYHNDFGKVNEKLSLVDRAIEEYQKALQILEKTDDLEAKAKSLFSIGILFFNQLKHQKAIPYFEKSLKIDLELNANNPIVVLQSYILLAKCHYKLNQFENGNLNYEEALKLVKLSKNETYINKVKSEKVGFLLEENKLEACVALGNELLNIKEFKDDTFFYYQTLVFLGEAHKKLKNNQTAIDYFIEVLENHTQSIYKNSLLNIYWNLYDIYMVQNETENALKYHIKYTETLREIQQEKEQGAMEQFQAKYESIEKEKEAAKHRSEALKFQLQSLRSQMNPHLVFNVISSISSHLKPNNIDNSKALLNSFARLMRANLEFAETEKITLEEEIKFLTDYLNLEKNRLGDLLSFEINYSEDLELDFIEIPSMLLQPYVENAIKHGIMHLEDNGKITIDFEEKEDTLYCTILDNGIGRKAAAKKQRDKAKHLGKSTHITKTRLELLSQKNKSEIDVAYFDLEKNKQDTGTKVVLKIAL